MDKKKFFRLRLDLPEHVRAHVERAMEMTGINTYKELNSTALFWFIGTFSDLEKPKNKKASGNERVISGGTPNS